MRFAPMLALVALAACSRPFDGGVRIVARNGAHFEEATSLGTEGDVVAIGWDAPSERGYQPRSYVVRADARYAEADGPWALWREDGHALVKVVRIEGGDAVLERPSGELRRPASELVPVPAGLREWAAREGEQRLQAAKISKLADRLAPSPLGGPILPGDPVAARWTDGMFYSGRVESVDGELVQVAWADGSAPSGVDAKDVASASASKLDDGSLLLCGLGPNYRMVAAQAIRLGGSELQVLTADATRRWVPRELCLASDPAQQSPRQRGGR